ncbi:MAG: hypothetical protein ABSB15_17350 [Bryobacteraceae bacterium]|jgi:hypothetical protein
MKLPWIVSFSVLACGLLLVPATSSGKPEYTRMTNQECNYCHVPNSRKLTDAGLYYRKHRTLKGFTPPKQ